MADDPGDGLAALLGAALREIRERTTGTQDNWHDETGMSQSYLSAAERGASGWDSVKGIANAIAKAGEDPLELLRIALRNTEAPEDERTLLTLWSRVDDPDIRGAVLTILRGQARLQPAANRDDEER